MHTETVQQRPECFFEQEPQQEFSTPDILLQTLLLSS